MCTWCSIDFLDVCDRLSIKLLTFWDIVDFVLLYCTQGSEHWTPQPRHLQPTPWISILISSKKWKKQNTISPAFDPLSSPVGPVPSPRYAWDMTSTLGDLYTALHCIASICNAIWRRALTVKCTSLMCYQSKGCPHILSANGGGWANADDCRQGVSKGPHG